MFPSPNSLASFPLHKRHWETRSDKRCAAFLNNCVTTWNGTCESFKNQNVHRRFSTKKEKKQAQRGSQRLYKSLFADEAHPNEPHQAIGVTWTHLLWHKLSKIQEERVRKRRFNWTSPSLGLPEVIVTVLLRGTSNEEQKQHLAWTTWTEVERTAGSQRCGQSQVELSLQDTMT